jgi:hypothetical protein
VNGRRIALAERSVRPIEAMNHYQKLAIVLVRCAGAGAVALGVLGFVYGAALVARGTSLSPDQAERFGSSVWYVVFGLVLFLLARPLGRLLGRRLE